jgi:CSLREA domain-containing protein
MLTLWSAQTAQATPLAVTKTADTADGTCDADCSLREAIIAANSAAGDDIITFAAATFGSSLQIINLSSKLPNLSTNIDLRGPGANLLTVRRNVATQFRIFNVDNGTTTGPIVIISGLTISNGSATVSGAQKGGAINNHFGTLTVQNSTISGNSASDEGGGIFNSNNGTLTVTNSTLSGNSATLDGGGIGNTGTATVRNSTISDNASGHGGGIFNSNSGTLTVANSTLSGNPASTSGGGIENDSPGAVTLQNSIVAGNTAPSANNIDGTASSSHSITDGTAAAAGLEVDINGKPRLKNNGGPTQTIALRLGSPASNTGDDTTAPPTDQRGYARRRVSDMGAFEFDGVPPVASRVDALIKKSSEAVTAFAMNDVYQLTPHFAQIETQSISVGTASYQMKVQNDTNLTRTVRVQAAASAEAGWTIVYKRGATDITTAIKSSGGYRTGSLAPGASEIITIEMTPAAGAGASKSTILRVFLSATDRVTRDAVQAVTTLTSSSSVHSG